MKPSRFKQIQKLAPQVAENIREELAAIPMSRADRRKLKRVEKHKAPSHATTKAHNTIEVAMSRSQTIGGENRQKLRHIVSTCMADMKAGKWGRPEWNTLADTLNVGAALANPYNICSDHMDKFHHAMDKMAEVADRVKKGYGWSPTAQDINAMEKAMEIFLIQIEFCSRGEYFNAIEHARKRIDAGKRGDLKNVIVVEPKEPEVA
jgi:hypothetical protein